MDDVRYRDYTYRVYTRYAGMTELVESVCRAHLADAVDQATNNGTAEVSFAGIADECDRCPKAVYCLTKFAPEGPFCDEQCLTASVSDTEAICSTLYAARHPLKDNERYCVGCGKDLRA